MRTKAEVWLIALAFVASGAHDVAMAEDPEDIVVPVLGILAGLSLLWMRENAERQVRLALNSKEQP